MGYVFYWGEMYFRDGWVLNVNVWVWVPSSVPKSSVPIARSIVTDAAVKIKFKSSWEIVIFGVYPMF